MLYIVRFLHQTTTVALSRLGLFRCISFVSYIKPQLSPRLIIAVISCISFVSYIKPQRLEKNGYLERVVYRSFPTSNHNLKPVNLLPNVVVYRSFPTSNHNYVMVSLFEYMLYIVRFLHQTTTLDKLNKEIYGCISFVSYIKPQPIISNKLYINILLILFIIKNGRVGFVYRKNTKKTPTEQVR